MKAKKERKEITLSIGIGKDGKEEYAAKNTGLSMHEAIVLVVWAQKILVDLLTNKIRGIK